MLDRPLRRFVDPPLDRLGARLAKAGFSANFLTLSGFGVGLLALPFLSAGAYGTALIAILLNRFADGLDGAVARARGASDLGGYLDIVCDFIFYGAVVFGFALVDGENRLPAGFLLLSFIGTGGSFLAFAALAARRGIETTARGVKSLYYLGGLTEGTETIVFFVVCCLFPGFFPVLAWIFAAACWITTVSRVVTASMLLRG
jgi:phosphatidylglycerophosphate synthase